MREKNKIPMDELTEQVEKYLEVDAVIDRIDRTLEDYQDLTPIEQEFAFRCATGFCSVNHICRTLGIGDRQQRRFMANVRIREMIADVRMDVRKFAAVKNMHLLQMAIDQYARIFAMQEDSKNLEAKRRASENVVMFWRLPNGEKSVTDTTMSLFIGMTGKDVEESGAKPPANIDMNDIRDRGVELVQIVSQVMKLGEKKDKRGEGDGF